MALPSATFFKCTVYGMRYACRLRGLPYQQFSLLSIEHNDKLPVVLNASEVRALIAIADSHRYACKAKKEAKKAHNAGKPIKGKAG